MEIHPTKFMGFYGVFMDIYGFYGVSWIFIGHSTSAFFAPCLRPRKGLRIRGK